MAASWPAGKARRQAAIEALGPEPRWLAGRDDLVIGIGNPLRGDDGVGWWLAQRAERWLPPSQLRAVRQLTPELASDIAAAARVLFIDAWLVPGGSGLAPTRALPGPPDGAGRSAGGAEADRPTESSASRGDAIAETQWLPVLRNLAPAGLESGSLARAGAQESLGAFSHQLSPGQLLGLSDLLFGGRPQAWVLLVPAFCLDHGEGFSQRLRRRLPGAQRLLRRWIQDRAATGLTRHA
jgi:hydrogenase maturation protease